MKKTFSLLLPLILIFLYASCQKKNEPAVIAKTETQDFKVTAVIDEINDNLQSIKRCYVDALEDKSPLKGKIYVDFFIGLEGQVTSVSVKESTVNYPPLETCVQEKVRKMSFPKPREADVEIIFPFVFGESS